MSLSTWNADAFCTGLIANLVLCEKIRLPMSGPPASEVDAAFGRVVSFLRATAATLLKEGNRSDALKFVKIINDIAPDPNTGSFDLFWAALRRQQPGRAGVGNPKYVRMSFTLNKPHAAFETDSIPSEWKSIVEKSAKIISTAL